MATDEDIVQRLTHLETMMIEVHNSICGNGEIGLVQRMRETELHQAELKKEMEIRQNWTATISATLAAVLSYLAAYFSIK